MLGSAINQNRQAGQARNQTIRIDLSETDTLKVSILRAASQKPYGLFFASGDHSLRCPQC